MRAVPVKASVGVFEVSWIILVYDKETAPDLRNQDALSGFAVFIGFIVLAVPIAFAGLHVFMVFNGRSLVL